MTTSNTEKVKGELPQNLDMERALLGAILVDNRALERLPEKFGEGHFRDPGHGEIFAAIQETVTRNQLASTATLRNSFNGAAMGGMPAGQYLDSLIGYATTIFNVPDYARVLLELSHRRVLISAAQDVIGACQRGAVDQPVASVIETLEATLLKVSEGAPTGDNEVLFDRAIELALDRANKAFQLGTKIVGLSSGVTDLDEIVGGLAPSDLLILGGRPAMGKAQPLDANVLLANGTWRSMGDLRFGDALASVDGAPSRVAGIFPQGERQVYRISFSDGRSTECCDGHLWSVHYRSWPGARTVTTAELRTLLTRKRYQQRLWVDAASGDFGANDDQLPVEPWLLGVLIGDGELSSSLTVTTTSPHILKQMKAAVGDGLVVRQTAEAITYGIRRAGSSYQGGVSNPMRDALRQLGLWGLGSPEKFIPEAYKTASRASRVALLQGLMDTDGWAEKFGAVCFGTTSKRLADDFVYLVRSLGGVASCNKRIKSYSHNGEKREGRPFYVCGVSHRGDCLFTEPHKIARVNDDGWRRRSTILSIEPSRHVETQCIKVTHPSQLYVTDDFIVTHNTSLATSIAYNVAAKYLHTGGKTGAPVHFFSQEMSAEQLATRVISEQSDLSSEKVRRGDFELSDFAKLMETGARIGPTPILIDQTGGLTLSQLASRARRMKRKKNTGLIIIDYLQLMYGTSKENRNQDLTRITNGLKALAKELNVPVIALSQLSRSVENREDKRPHLADLRESGSIEQDADIVMFVFREEYYLERAKPDPTDLGKTNDWNAKMGEVRNVAEILIGKHRHGRTGSVKLQFTPEFTRFSNLAGPKSVSEAYTR